VPSHKHNVISIDGEICPSEFVENTEFSGKLDIDHIEIYEGDNLEAKYLRKYLYEGVVVFNEGSFCLKITKTPIKCIDYDIGSTPELNNFDTLKIIGNIYEE
jgi:hypothetical protein